MYLGSLSMYDTWEGGASRQRRQQKLKEGFSWSFVNVGCLYIQVCIILQLCLEMWFSTSFDITWYTEAAIYAKNLLFSHSEYITSLENGRRKFWFGIYCYYYWEWIDTPHYLINTHAEEKQKKCVRLEVYNFVSPLNSRYLQTSLLKH